MSGFITNHGGFDAMKVETIQTEDLSELDSLINEAIEQRRVKDIKLTTTVFQEKVLYTALVMLEN